VKFEIASFQIGQVTLGLVTPLLVKFEIGVVKLAESHWVLLGPSVNC